MQTETNEEIDIVSHFWDALPFFLSIGMTEEEFWNSTILQRDAWYRKYELELERQNFMCWVQGQYITAGAHADKQGKINYPKEPFRLTPLTPEEEQAEIEKQFRLMSENFTKLAEANRKKKEKGGSK